MRSTKVSSKPRRPSTSMGIRSSGNAAKTKSLNAQPEAKSVVRSVYTNRDLLKHPSVRDYVIMPLSTPTPHELIPNEPGSTQGRMEHAPRGTPVRAQSAAPSRRGVKTYTPARGAKQDPARSLGASTLGDDADQDFVDAAEFNAMRLEAEELWQELRLPQRECDHLAATIFSSPVVSNAMQAAAHLHALEAHRVRSLQVLQVIEEREESLNAIRGLLRDEDGASRELLSVLPTFRRQTQAVIESIQAWREGMWRPLPFVWGPDGGNYLDKVAQDAVELLGAADWLTGLPVEDRDLETRGGGHPGCFVFLQAERPDRLLARDQRERLAACEATVFAEGDLQRQLSQQAALLAKQGFTVPTLRPVEDGGARMTPQRMKQLFGTNREGYTLTPEGGLLATEGSDARHSEGSRLVEVPFESSFRGEDTVGLATPQRPESRGEGATRESLHGTGLAQAPHPCATLTLTLP